MAQNNTSPISIHKIWKLEKVEPVGKVMGEIDGDLSILDFRDKQILYSGSNENGGIDSIFYKIEDNEISLFKDDSPKKPRKKIEYMLYIRIDSLSEKQLILIFGGKKKNEIIEAVKFTYSLME